MPLAQVHSWQAPILHSKHLPDLVHFEFQYWKYKVPAAYKNKYNNKPQHPYLLHLCITKRLRHHPRKKYVTPTQKDMKIRSLFC